MQKAQNRHKEAETVQYAEIEDHLPKLKLENPKLSYNKKKTKENKQLQKNLIIAYLLQEAHGQHKEAERSAEYETENSKLEILIEKETGKSTASKKSVEYKHGVIVSEKYRKEMFKTTE